MAYTQSQLEALKNSLLASNQPDKITAAKHRQFEQAVIYELFDPESRGNLLALVQTVLNLNQGDKVLVITNGVLRAIDIANIATSGGTRAFKGRFTTDEALLAAYPNDAEDAAAGDYAQVGETNSYWERDSTTLEWYDTGDVIDDEELDLFPTLGSTDRAATSDGTKQLIDGKADSNHSHSSEEAWLAALIDTLVKNEDLLELVYGLLEQGTGMLIEINEETGKIRFTNTGSGEGSSNWGAIGGNIEDQADLKATYLKKYVWKTSTLVGNVRTFNFDNAQNPVFRIEPIEDEEWVFINVPSGLTEFVSPFIRIKYSGIGDFTATLPAGTHLEDGTDNTISEIPFPTGKTSGYITAAWGYRSPEDEWTWSFGEAAGSSGTSHFKGTYTSLANLEAAHPTGEPGDEALVDAGVGTNAQKYIWDESDGAWIPGGGTGASTFSDLTGAPTDNAALATELTNAKARANHTGTQAISTIVGLQTSLDGKVKKASWIPVTGDANIDFDLAGEVEAAFKYTEAGAATWTISNPPSDAALKVELQIKVTLASASHLITLPANVKENGTTIPSKTLTGTSGDVITVQLIKDNSDWELFVGADDNALPSGGTTGQTIIKNSGTDGDAGWSTKHFVPPGGLTNQVLKKNSATDGDASWQAEAGGGSVTYATSTEVNTGTEAAKAIAPDQLAASNYMYRTMGKISASTSGTNTYTATITPSITAYSGGDIYKIKFGNGSSAASTINLNSLGAKKLFKSPTVQAGSGDIVASNFHWIVYDAALDSAAGGFLIMNPKGATDSSTSAEINTGAEASKYIAPDQLAASGYMFRSMSKISASTSGTNTYAATIAPAITTYTGGDIYKLKFGNASSGASTVNLNSLGAKKLYKSPTVQAGSGDIIANIVHWVVYDASLDSAAGGFLIMNPNQGVTDGDKTDIIVSSSGNVWVIDSNVVTFSKMQQIPPNTFPGNVGGSTANMEAVAGVELFAASDNTTTTATSYSMVLTDRTIDVTDTSAPRTITLVDPGTVSRGRRVTITDDSNAAATNNITIATAAGTIVGNALINTNCGARTYKSNGSNRWSLIATS
jgi:hypothetical protein